tara:strand:+ start:639 stop:1952 length:1314 start_codon:yes stop_codon:yes gene_type:complete
MLKKFIEGVKDVLPAIGGTIGYAVAGPAGAALGSGLGSIVRGDPGQEAFQNALLAGSIGAGGQRFLSGGSGPIGQFFSRGTIPGVVGDTGILRSFSQRSFSPGMTKLGFGGKYLPVEPEVSARMIGANTPVYDTGTGKTIMTGGQTISGDTLAEFDRLKGLGTGENDLKILEMARDNVLSGKAGSDEGILSQALEFAKTNPELVIGGGILLDQMGFFDEGDKDELPKPPEIGSQGSLPGGIARLVNPVLTAGGQFSYDMSANGGIMRAKEGKQAKKFLVGPDDLEEFLNDPSRFIQTSPNAPKLYDRDQKFKVLEKLGIVGRAAEGMLMERRFNPEGGFQEMKEGNIASFQENSPRRDLFLERDGPISDDRGSPDKDTVFAKLADGEFVVNADTVADIGYGMGAKSLDQAKEMGGSFFYGLQDAQKKGILGNMVGMA